MNAPDARIAFLNAVMDPADMCYTVEDMSNPEVYMPVMSRALPKYLKRLQVTCCPACCSDLFRRWHVL